MLKLVNFRNLAMTAHGSATLGIRAFLFALILPFPGTVSYKISEDTSWRIFNDWDEAFYFPLAREMGKLTPFEIYRYQDAPPYWNTSWGISLPHYLGTGLVGRLMNATGSSVPLAALLLDFLCAFFAYILLSKFFRALSNDRIGEIAAFGLLMTPWIYPLTANFPEWIWKGFSLNSRSQYVCLPILRGVNTQLSYLVFPFCFLLSLPSRIQNAKKSFLLGSLTGFLIYVYVFSWVAVSLVIGLSLLLRLANNSSKSRSESLKSVLSYGAGNLLVAACGILWVQERMRSGVLDVEHTPTWVLSIEAIAILSTLLMVRLLRVWKLSEIYLLAAVTAEILLSNSQHFTNAVTADYHMLSLYLHPFITGCLFTQVLSLIDRRKFLSFLLLLLFTLAITLSGIRATSHARALHSEYESDFSELITYARTSLSVSDSLLVIGWPKPFQNYWTGRPVNILQPYWINALASRDTFLGQPKSEGSVAEKELYTAFLFTGKLQSVGSCPPEDTLASDSLWEYANADRQRTCAEMAERIRTLSLCELLSRAKTEYVLFESEYGLTPPAALSDVMKEVWKSTHSNLRVMSFDHIKAQKRYCAEQKTKPIPREDDT